MSTANASNVDPLECSSVSAQCPVEASIYGYYPNLAANAFFCALFSTCFLVNLYFGWKYRTWTYMIAMSLACATSALGYGGRIKMHDNPFDIIGFQIQICCLTLSPAFNSAAIYLTLKHIVRAFGREWSRLRPKFYTWIFILADLLALILQGTGGGIAATANTDASLRVGDRLMETGISVQVLTLLVFGILCLDFIIRRWRSPLMLSLQAKATKEDKKFQIFAGALLVTYLSIFTRCVYRIAEMAGGWSNPIMQDEALFVGIDSSLVGLATVLQTFIHPGQFFRAMGKDKVVENEKNTSNSTFEESV